MAPSAERCPEDSLIELESMRKPLCVSVRLVILPVLSVQKGDLPLQGIGAIAPQQIAAIAQQQQLQNLTQQLQSQLSLQNMNLSFFNQVRPAPLFPTERYTV